ncbi:MAG: YqgE/AlgH family protein [Flavobacteriales bacterium]
MIKTITKGNILIAKPVSYDHNFDQSVIVLTDHGENGSVGFIQNKPTDYKVRDLLKELNCDYTVFNGGPVEKENIYYFHSRSDLISNSIEIYSGLFWSGDFKDVTYAINHGLIEEHEIRFFLGYSGWSKGQLNLELENDSWYILNKNIALTSFKKGEYSVWQKMLKIMGGNYLLWINTPFDPTLN